MSGGKSAGSMIIMAWVPICVIGIAARSYNIACTTVQAQEQHTIKAPQRNPIRVGANVQASKLIYRVEPQYPEEAKAAGLTGKVVLVVTVNEDGFVSDLKVASGRPILADAAVAAVKQWRYSPTLLNGEQPVPVIATVTVSFSNGGPADNTNTEEPPFVNGYDVVPIVIPPNPVDFEAPAHIHFKEEPLLSYGGYEYYTVVPPISAPVLAIDKERLRELANARWPAAGMEPITFMVFQLFITQSGEIAGIRQIQGPKISEIEGELANTRVVSPARFDSKPVPVWVAVEIDIPN